MSVDMIMYHVAKPTAKDMAVLKNAHYDDIESMCDDSHWGLKAYLKSEVDARSDRFADLIKYMKLVVLRRTITDYKRCYIDHGMPENVTSYCCSHRGHEIVLTWAGNSVRISREKLAEYSHEEENEYYVIRRCEFDGDVSNYMARTMMNTLENEFGGDWSYRPCALTKKVAEALSRVIIKEQDDGNLYSVDQMMDFIVELMRSIVDKQKDLFIEFQD